MGLVSYLTSSSSPGVENKGTTSSTSPANADFSDLYNPNEIVAELRKIAPKAVEHTAEHFVELIKRNGTKLISLLHIGEDGLLKTLDFCPFDEAQLMAILEGGERCDGSSIFPNSGIPTSSSDIVLSPRLDTAFFDPFVSVPRSVLCFFCWHYGADGQLLPQSPETILHRAEEELLKAGHIIWAHGEVEYFVGKELKNSLNVMESDHGYHAAAPYVFGQDLRREAIAILGKLGVHVKYAHSENGYVSSDVENPVTWEQHEIELSLEPVSKAARSAVLTKWVLSSLSQIHGMQISFDPICRKGHIGSGFHVHMSPRHGDGPDDYDLIRDEKTHDLSSEAVHLIAGLSQVGGALMSFGNRKASSFVRLSQGKEAPNRVSWGDRNRRALIRLPLVAKNEAGDLVAPPTIEFRLGDGSAHPYLLMAGLAMAMLYGSYMDSADALALVAATEANQERDAAGAELEVQRKVPQNRIEVVAELRTFREAFERGGVFPTEMIDAIVAGRSSD